MARLAQRFLHPYYLTNFLLLLIYPLVRFTYGIPDSLRDTRTMLGFTKEVEMILLAFVALIVKFARAATLDQYLDKVFLFGKMANGALLFYINRPFATGYLVIAFVTLAVLNPPKILNLSIESMGMGAFQEVVKNCRDPRRAALVMFHCDWCKDCTLTEPIFSRIADRFRGGGGGGGPYRFAKVDLVRFPELADEYAVDVSGTSKQLPTFILFYKGEEVKRMPTFKSDGQVVKTGFDVKGMMKWFELDKDFTQTSYYLQRSKKRTGKTSFGKKKDS